MCRESFQETSFYDHTGRWVVAVVLSLTACSFDLRGATSSASAIMPWGTATDGSIVVWYDGQQEQLQSGQWPTSSSNFQNFRMTYGTKTIAKLASNYESTQKTTDLFYFNDNEANVPESHLLNL